MKTPEQEYFTNFLAETPTGVYNKLTAEKKKQELQSSKKKGFFSCCSKGDDESELNMTRLSMKPIQQKKYNYDDEPKGNDENRGVWPSNIVRLYAVPKPE